MSEQQRKPISKKTRFEVFKRDGFTCQYCGAHPPEATLQVDHIHPVAEGGSDDMDNLVTACEPCNNGKRARLLTSVPQSLQEKADLIAEREEQLRGYHDVIEGKRRRLDSEAARVAEVYERFDAGYTLSPSSLVSVRQFIEKLGVHEVIDAMEIAGIRKTFKTGQIFRYFCGVCWNKIRDQK
ncbi:HNH endonuclease [Cupriavidus numazuensis]|uniref:HNH nuclease domain-containing protein n=1 Tax=Cupriavidus numazuensis TaxID=221992 RepID=A0ABM8TBB1_9BURK|nr:HNH endonuclease [Cupriavidus numazuensis]CAG2132336.1 hypothetical protein LMG26411_00599 [Cupriavidus numazuensis]